MKLKSLPWLLILFTLCLAWWARRHLIEEQQLAFFCEAGGQTLACRLHSLIVVIFYNSNAMGYFTLCLGAVAALTRSDHLSLWAGIVGIASLVLHNGESAAIGFLLGVLTLARTQVETGRAQHRACQ
ncbi:MAG: hypothetical protein PHW13_10180 [Methylococcales bacterium]|nr:hypothetical protein [Methylococcales bacterium]